jgi:hypothetical protein
MKTRLVTGLITGILGAGVGAGVAIWQGLNDHMLGIALATGLAGLAFGIVFKLKLA